MQPAQQLQERIKPGHKAILNLGLGAPTLGGRKTVAHRIRTFQRACRDVLYPDFKAELQIVPRHVFMGEPLLVVEGGFNLNAKYTLTLWDALIEAEQDCIAVYYPELDQPTGYLIGPNANLWGDFNVNFFRFFGDDKE